MYVTDVTSDISFLVDNDASIYLIFASATDRISGRDKLTLHAVKKYIIHKYGLKFKFTSGFFFGFSSLLTLKLSFGDRFF